jgi:hypothetical protein
VREVLVTYAVSPIMVGKPKPTTVAAPLATSPLVPAAASSNALATVVPFSVQSKERTVIRGKDGKLVLPSAGSAASLVRGEAGALPLLLLHMVGRAGIIGTGLWLAGAGQDTIKYAFAGSMAIEAFVLLYAKAQYDAEA